MPCLWGSHNNSQIFLDVAILPADFSQQIPEAIDLTKSPSVFKALVDTGAQSTCITKSVAEQVNLTPIGKVPVQGVSGIQYHNNYMFMIGLPDNLPAKDKKLHNDRQLFMYKELEGVELKSPSKDFQILLGMDIISIGSLKIEGNGTFSFSY